MKLISTISKLSPVITIGGLALIGLGAYLARSKKEEIVEEVCDNFENVDEMGQDEFLSTSINTIIDVAKRVTPAIIMSGLGVSAFIAASANVYRDVCNVETYCNAKSAWIDRVVSNREIGDVFDGKDGVFATAHNNKYLTLMSIFLNGIVGTSLFVDIFKHGNPTKVTIFCGLLSTACGIANLDLIKQNLKYLNEHTHVTDWLTDKGHMANPWFWLKGE